MDAMKGVSAVVLAGGCSSRMGRNKAELMFCGQTLLHYQIDKLRRLEIEDIIVSNYHVNMSEVRAVPDIYPCKGPLSGIHAALLNARFDHCLVLSVDAPLVPEEVLLELVIQHRAGKGKITVLEHGGKLEPLIGVYERQLADAAEEILKSDNTSIRALMHKSGFSLLTYDGDESLLLNCNTPREYEILCKLQGSGHIF